MRTRVYIGGLLLTGFCLLRWYHSGQLHVDMRGKKTAALPTGTCLVEGTFQAPRDIAQIVIHDYGNLSELKINQAILLSEDMRDRSGGRLLLISGLQLKKGMEYSYSGRVKECSNNHYREFFSPPSSAWRALRMLGLNSLFLAALLFIFHLKRILKPELMILQAAFFLRTFYISEKTLPFERAWDFFAHRDYVQHVLDGKWLPAPSDCWECFQPPVAYWAAAAHRNLSQVLLPMPLDSFLQFHSLCLGGLLLVQLLFLIKSICADSNRRMWILIPCVFWPQLVIKSSAFGNDLLIYNMWIFACRLFLLSDGRRANILLFIGVSLLGVFTKRNFLILPVSFILSRAPRLKLWVLPASFLILTGGAWYLTKKTSLIPETELTRIINPSLSLLRPARKVRNEFSHVFGLSWNLLWKHPHLENGTDETGRQYMSNYLLKSGVLSGSRDIAGAGAIFWGRMLIGLNLVLFLSFLIATFNPRPIAASMTLQIQIWTAVTFSFLYRIITSCAIAADARYILPALIFMIILSGEYFLTHRTTAIIFKAWSAMLVISSVSFFLTIHTLF